MVRNHQDGYHYINLSQFFFWKYTEMAIFLEKLIGKWIPDRDGRGIARDIKRNYFHFQNLTKNGNKVWTTSNAEMTLLISSFAFFVVVENIQNRQFFLEKLIGQWIPDHDGWGIARDIKKNILIFKTLQKTVTKLGQFTKLGHFSFSNCPNFVTSNPPPIAVRNSLTNKLF